MCTNRQLFPQPLILALEFVALRLSLLECSKGVLVFFLEGGLISHSSQLPLLYEKQLLLLLELLLEAPILAGKGVDFGSLLFELVDIHALNLDVECVFVDEVVVVGFFLQGCCLPGFAQ